MRAHYLQHVPFEALGSIESWLEAHGYEITHTRFFESTDLPEIKAIESGKPVLGICLGAQMIASAMGARVFPNPVKEIGWFPIHAVDSIDFCREDLVPSTYVQTEEEILSAGSGCYEAINHLMGNILTFLGRNKS
jgi:hypothetical protein